SWFHKTWKPDGFELVKQAVTPNAIGEKMNRTLHLALTAIAFTGALSITTANAQTMPAAIPLSTTRTISTPDKLDTPIGKLTFSDGVPTGDTAKTLYDNLDRTRGVTV